MTRNVVLLVLDTVRKDVFDERAHRIRERSDRSFERAYAPSSWTVPSHASMFTGQLAHRHGIHAHNVDYSGLAVEETFLSDHDLRRIGVSTNSFLSPRFGFDGLFDNFVNFHGNEELVPGGIDTASFMQESAAAGPSRYLQYLHTAWDESALTPSLTNAAYMKLNNAVLGRPIPRLGDYGARVALRTAVDRAADAERFFLFVNLVDAHAPHEALRSYDTDVPYSWTSRQHGVWEVNNRGVEEFSAYLDSFRELYSCAVEYLDRRVSSFLDSIRTNVDGETTVIVTSDHGEELGQPSERTLGHKIPSAGVSHVPLEVVNPPDAWSDEPVTDLVSLLDLGEIVRAIAEETEPDVTRAAAPVERLGDPHPPDERTAFWNRAIRTVYSSEESYEWDTFGARNRYEVSRSTERLVDDGAEIPDSCLNAFEVELEETKERAERGKTDLEEEVDDRTRGRLEDLGYM